MQETIRKDTKKQQNGITLIALVITIIVLLILAGVALSMLTGENSVLKRATGAKEATERAEIEEALKLAYIDLVGEDVLNHGSSTSLTQAVNKVNSEYGNVIESKGASGPAITGVKLSNSDIVIGTTASSNSTTVTVEVLTGESNGTSNNYYAKINGQYYQVNDDCSIAKTATKFTGGDTNNPTITVATGDSSIATASISGNTITITGATPAKADDTALNVTVNGTTYPGGTITAKNLATVSSISNTTLTIDGAYLLTATVSSGDAKDVIWESQNPDIATVTSEGVVKCSKEKSGETATILCKSAGATKQCTVTSTAKIATSKGTGAPTVPSGFTAIDTADAKWSNATAQTDKGLVIMDEKGNEFVWVPVPNAIYDSSKDGDLPTSTSSGTNNGKTYTPMAINIATGGTQNGAFNAEGTYKGILYSYDSTAGAYLMYPSRTNKQGSCREPDTVSNYDNGQTYTPSGSSETKTYLSIIEDTINSKYKSNSEYSNMTNFGNTMQKDYKAMVQSVATNGGFYIGRYESSLINGKTRVVAGATSMNALENNANRWYGLYARQKNFAVDNGLTSVESDMIWGSQYDAMMNWMAKNGVDVTATGTKNSYRITGKVATDKKNNVFDLLGNSYEWTAEVVNTGNRAYRGGISNYDRSPSYRDYSCPDNAYAGYSSRPTLFIQ